MKVFYTEDQKFEVRPWGGRMCFLATEDSAQSKLLGVTAVLRMGQGLTHSTHTHDDCDEIILVLNGEGSQLFQEEDGTEIRYDLHPDDLLYIAKNRVQLFLRWPVRCACQGFLARRVQHGAEHSHAGHMRQQHRERRKPDGRARPDCADSHDAQRGLCVCHFRRGQGQWRGAPGPCAGVLYQRRGMFRRKYV